MSWPWPGQSVGSYSGTPRNASRSVMMTTPLSQQMTMPHPPDLFPPPLPFNPSLSAAPMPFAGPPPPPQFDGVFPPNDGYRPWLRNTTYPPHSFHGPAGQGLAGQHLFPAANAFPPPFPQPPSALMSYRSEPSEAQQGPAYYGNDARLQGPSGSFEVPTRGRVNSDPGCTVGRERTEQSSERLRECATTNKSRQLERGNIAGMSKTNKKACLKQNTRKDKKDASPRDVATCAQVLNKLGASLPGESRADIDKWVAERRRKWPSRANVAKKLAEEAEREARGQLPLQDKERPRTNKKPRESMHAGRQANGPSLKRPRTSSIDEAGDGDALQRLAADYGSSGGEEEEGEIRSCPIGSKVTRKLADNGQLNKPNSQKNGRKRQKRRNGRNRGRNARPPTEIIVPSRPSLLRQLLEGEIKKERSILLQAFRHICQHAVSS